MSTSLAVGGEGFSERVDAETPGEFEPVLVQQIPVAEQIEGGPVGDDDPTGQDD